MLKKVCLLAVALAATKNLWINICFHNKAEKGGKVQSTLNKHLEEKGERKFMRMGSKNNI